MALSCLPQQGKASKHITLDRSVPSPVFVSGAAGRAAVCSTAALVMSRHARCVFGALLQCKPHATPGVLSCCSPTDKADTGVWSSRRVSSVIGRTSMGLPHQTMLCRQLFLVH